MNARGGIAAIAAFAALGALAQPGPITPFSSAQPGTVPPPGWSPLTFPRIERPTRYELVRDDGAVVVAATAERSASGWIYRLDQPIGQALLLRWRWKAERLPADGDTRSKLADDAVARLYVTFRHPPERLTWAQRAIDAAIRAIYGETPPHASLMYVWDTRAPPGTRIVNPYTDRVRNIVVESGPARAGQWLAYERDLAADYRAAFGEEPTILTGVAIMTDADNTRGEAAARYGDVSLSAR